MKLKAVVMDTNIMVSIVISKEPNHKNAKALETKLKSEGLQIVVPMTAVFETICVFKRKKMEKAFDLSKQIDLQFIPVNIDLAFLDTYYYNELPYTKSGDLFLMAISKRLNIPLITEDKQLLKAARSISINAFNILEYLEK